MTLTEADMIAVGNAALRLLDLPERAEFDHVYDQSAFIATWLADGDTIVGSNGIPLLGTPQDIALAVLDGLTNDLSETSLYWGVAFPRCPGHHHPAEYGCDDDKIWLACPQTTAVFREVTL